MKKHKIMNNSFKDLDFQYQLEYDSKESRDCFKYGCDGICRCSKITDANVTSSNKKIQNAVAEMFMGFLPPAKNDRQLLTTKFLVDRLVSTLKISYFNFNINITNGYYGQELEKITLEEEFSSKLTEMLAEFKSLSSFEEKVNFCLVKEYGYLLPDLENAKYTIVNQVKFDDIEISNKNYYKRIDSSFYQDGYSYPIKCLCIKTGDKTKKYRLIDGYHRLLQVSKGSDSFSIICATPSDLKT